MPLGEDYQPPHRDDEGATEEGASVVPRSPDHQHHPRPVGPRGIVEVGIDDEGVVVGARAGTDSQYSIPSSLTHLLCSSSRARL